MHNYCHKNDAKNQFYSGKFDIFWSSIFRSFYIFHKDANLEIKSKKIKDKFIGFIIKIKVTL